MTPRRAEGWEKNVYCGLQREDLNKLGDKYEAVWPGRVRTVLYKSDHPSEASGHHAVRHSLGQLSSLRPHYCCFLAHHSECSKLFVQEVNRMTRELDTSHPYTDTIWGILTGFVEEDVISTLEQKPLLIGRVVANCPVDLEKFRAGVWFSESEQGSSYCKVSRESKVTKERCPDDATELIACEISDERRSCDKNNPSERGVDMIITSGHATEKDWNIAYCFKGGKFLCNKGQLYGSTLAGRNIDLRRSQNPKVLSAAGNCLMGHISDENCMALGWMHSAKVVQMVGYVEPTWFGYGGWGVHKYFINNPGSLSLAESFFANQQSLLHELHSKFSVEEVETQIGNHRSVYDMCFNTSSSGGRGVSRECCGLIYDRDNVVFYGDPAWRAEMESNPEVYDYTLV